MKTRVIVACLVFLAVAAMAGNVGAQPVWGNPWAPTPNTWGLTAEQTSQIQNIENQWQREMQLLWSNLQAKNLELQSLRWRPNPEPAAVEASAKEIGEIQARIQAKSVELRSAIRGVLTEEQQTVFDQQGLGAGWGGDPYSLGMGLGWSGGFGRGGGFRGGRGRGWSMGAPGGAYGGAFYGGGGRGWPMGAPGGAYGGAFYGGGGRGWPMGAPGGAYGGAFYGRGRGPCGMGLAAGPMGSWMGRRRW